MKITLIGVRLLPTNCLKIKKTPATGMSGPSYEETSQKPSMPLPTELCQEQEPQKKWCCTISWTTGQKKISLNTIRLEGWIKQRVKWAFLMDAAREVPVIVLQKGSKYTFGCIELTKHQVPALWGFLFQYWACQELVPDIHASTWLSLSRD
jgi:hypothetical protein